MSYRNSFYAQMRKHKRAHWLECLRNKKEGNVKLAELHRKNYSSYKDMMKMWRFNVKHVKVHKLKLIEKAMGKVNKVERVLK